MTIPVNVAETVLELLLMSAKFCSMLKLNIMRVIRVIVTALHRHPVCSGKQPIPTVSHEPATDPRSITCLGNDLG